MVQSERAILGSGHKTTFMVLTGASKGSKLAGRVDVVPVIDPNSPLGLDPRMQSVIRILPPVPFLTVNDILDDGAKKWKLGKKEDNPGSVTVDFQAELQI